MITGQLTIEEFTALLSGNTGFPQNASEVWSAFINEGGTMQIQDGDTVYATIESVKGEDFFRLRIN